MRDDLQHCFAGNPNDRFTAAAQLAKNLRSLPERRRAFEERLRLEQSARRRRTISALSAAAAVVLLLVAISLAFGLRRAEQQRNAADQNAYAAKMLLAQADWDNNNITHLRELLSETRNYPDRGFEWFYWSQFSRQELHTFSGHLETTTAVVFSPDGQYILTASDDYTAKLWDVRTGAEVFTLGGHKHNVRSLAFFPDGHRFVTGSLDNTAKIWETSSGRELFALRGHKGGIIRIDFSPDATRILTTSDDSTARIWDANDGRELLNLAHEERVRFARFTSDGQHIVTRIRAITTLWDATTGKALYHWSGTSFVELSPDRTRILLATSNGSVEIWSTTPDHALLTFRGHTSEVFRAIFSPDGQRVLTSSATDGTTRLWNATNGLPIQALERMAWSVFSPDSQRFAGLTPDRRIKVCDAATGDEILNLRGHDRTIMDLEFAPNSRAFVTTSQDRTAKIWAADAEQGYQTIKEPGEIRAVAFSPDGRRLLTVGADHVGRVRDALTTHEITTFKGHQAEITSGRFSPDGKYILTGSKDNTARLWDAVTGHELRIFAGHKGWVLSVAFSPDGTRIVTGSNDGTANVWDSSTGKALLTVRGHQLGLTTATFSPNGRHILTASWDRWDRTAKVWDAASGHQLHSLMSHTDIIAAAAFSPDGRRIVTASRDRTIKLWDAQSGRELLTLKGHSGTIRSVAFSPDGRRILSASDDQTARLWEANTGRELLTLRGPQSALTSVTFSPNGRSVASAAADGSLTLWTAAAPEEATRWQAEEALAAQKLLGLEHDRARLLEKENAAQAADPGAIRDWLIVAPVSIPEKSGLAGLRREMIPGEARLKPKAGEKVQIDGREFVWNDIHVPHYAITFDELLGEPREFSGLYPRNLAYLVCYIASETTRTDLVFKIGSDDEARLYLNGKQIFECTTTSRALVPDADEVRGFTLNQGLNTVIFKVANEEGPWAGSLHLTDSNGQPVKGIKVTLQP